MAFDPISGAITGGATLLDFFMKQKAQNLAESNLQSQRANALREYELATAGRTDAYGNKVAYDPASNTWRTILSPTQQALADAGQREDLLNLQVDQPQNRLIRAGEYQRGRQAGDAFNEAMQGYRYGPNPSEGAIRGEIAQLLSGAKADQAAQNAALLGRQALRIGRGGDIPGIVKATNDAVGSNLANTLLQARETALQEKGQREQQRSSKYLPALSEFAQLGSGGKSGAAPGFGAENLLSQVQGQSAGNVLNALAQGGQGVNTASIAATKSGQNLLDLKDIGSLYSSLAGTSKGGTQRLSGDTTTPTYRASSTDTPDYSLPSGGGAGGGWFF